MYRYLPTCHMTYLVQIPCHNSLYRYTNVAVMICLKSSISRNSSKLPWMTSSWRFQILPLLLVMSQPITTLTACWTGQKLTAGHFLRCRAEDSPRINPKYPKYSVCAVPLPVHRTLLQVLDRLAKFVKMQICKYCWIITWVHGPPNPYLYLSQTCAAPWPILQAGFA